jgi:1-acyl-sn-glycerol-3-phosphate acyltransferase
MKRHFHAFAMDARNVRGQNIPSETPLIVFGNHPGWWDPIVGMIVNQSAFPGRTLYSPIDAAALEKYGVFKKLGFYGIDLSSTRGAAAFLKTSRAIMAQPNTALWITPEGRFADPRDHSQPLMHGLAHLAHDAPNALLVPIAIEYPFWEERLPEALVRLGRIIRADETGCTTKPQWQDYLTNALRETQRELAESSIARRTEDFELLVSSKLRRSWYDFFRLTTARLRGKSIPIEHGKKFVERE